jgi:hypothetical protein
MTGRAAGYCAGYGVPGYMNPVPGRGYWGRGRGGGWGWRNWYRATGMPGWARAARGMPAWGQPWGYGAGAPYAPTRDQQADALKAQVEVLEQQLEDLRSALADLEQQTEE